jgi:hypothetical protein
MLLRLSVLCAKMTVYKWSYFLVGAYHLYFHFWSLNQLRLGRLQQKLYMKFPLAGLWWSSRYQDLPRRCDTDLMGTV